MTQIVSSIEIAQPPAEVFAYVTDPLRLAEWQESLLEAHPIGEGPGWRGLEGGDDPHRRAPPVDDDDGADQLEPPRTGPPGSTAP